MLILQNIDDILNDLLSLDEKVIYDNNVKYDAIIKDIAGYITKCHEIFSDFLNLKEEIITKLAQPEQKRILLIRGFSYLSFDHAYTSTRLLIRNYIEASGNMFRQALEAFCLTILLTFRNVNIGSNNKKQNIDFFEEFNKDNPNTRAFKAINIVLLNAELLGITKESIDIFDEIKKNLNEFCHPTIDLMYTRLLGKDGRRTVNGQLYEPLNFDNHYISRKNYLSIVPDMQETIMRMLKQEITNKL